MRTIKFLSPSALKMWETEREEFYKYYLCPTRNPKGPQTEAMSVGSAFDAYIKSTLHSQIYGHNADPRFTFEALFEAQVEEDARTFAREAGLHCYERYVKSGAYDDLMSLLNDSDIPPQFEFTLTGEVSGIPLLGKPDCWFKRNGIGVVLDWKVNGYCGKSPTSPKKGYIACVDAWAGEEGKPTRAVNKRNGISPIEYAGMKINQHPLEDSDKGWADQLAIYAWMLDFQVGDDSYVACIDQLACKPGDPQPLIRVAQHRTRVSSFWQFALLDRLRSCWSNIQAGHIFTDVSLEESQKMCEVLDMQDYSQYDDFTASLQTRSYKG